MSSHRLSVDSQRRRQVLRNLPSNLPLYWATFVSSQRDLQRQRDFQRQPLRDFPNILSNFDPYVSDILLEYIYPTEYFELFYILHGTQDGLEALNPDLTIRNHKFFAGLEMGYYGPKFDEMMLANGPNYPVFRSICREIHRACQQTMDFWNELIFTEDGVRWVNEIKELYEEKIIQYLIENGIPNPNYADILLDGLDPKFRNIDILDYVIFDIRTMVDLALQSTILSRRLEVDGFGRLEDEH